LSLMKIHKDSLSGKSQGFLSRFVPTRGHFSKLRKGHSSLMSASVHLAVATRAEEGQKNTGMKSAGMWHEKKNTRKDMIIIAIIAAIVIAVILVELVMFGGGEAPQAVSNDSINGTNDTLPIPIIVTNTTKKPDLDIKPFAISKSEAEVGDIIELSVSVKNTGKVNATNVSVELLLGSERIDYRSLGVIMTDETIVFKINWTAEDVGQYTFKVIADPGNSVDESNELNNEETVPLKVTAKIVQDITGDFKLQSTANFNEYWYSEKFRLPPPSGEGYAYFQITKQSDGIYYLDVSVPGFKATRIGKVSGIAIPDGSDSGWNSNWCIKESMASEACIWNGPLIALSFEFKSGKLKVEDSAGVDSTTTSSDRKISKIKLIGLKQADWPGNLTTWKASGAADRNMFVPEEFYESYGGKLYITPLKWNLGTLEAEAATWFRFEIETS